MARQDTSRVRGVMLVVLGVIVIVLVIFLIIAIVKPNPSDSSAPRPALGPGSPTSALTQSAA